MLFFHVVFQLSGQPIAKLLVVFNLYSRRFGHASVAALSNLCRSVSSICVTRESCTMISTAPYRSLPTCSPTIVSQLTWLNGLLSNLVRVSLIFSFIE